MKVETIKEHSFYGKRHKKGESYEIRNQSEFNIAKKLGFVKEVVDVSEYMHKEVVRLEYAINSCETKLIVDPNIIRESAPNGIAQSIDNAISASIDDEAKNASKMGNPLVESGDHIVEMNNRRKSRQDAEERDAMYVAIDLNEIRDEGSPQKPEKPSRGRYQRRDMKAKK